MNIVSYNAAHGPGLAGDPELENVTVISAIFTDQREARAAVRELREIGIPAEDISMISRNEDRPQDLGPSGEPAQEDPPDMGTETTRRSTPVFIDVDVPPDEPLGGSDLLGLTRDGESAPHKEAYPNADGYIYTDYPDEPSRLNPEFPPADLPREPWVNRTGPAEGAAIGAGVGSLVGLLAGMAGLTIPGIGPMIAAGPLASALSGLVTGGATGGIVGALATIGVPEEYAHEYASQIEHGRTLVSVRADEITLDPVERVLIANGGESVGYRQT
jgi:hypothetical protein